MANEFCPGYVSEPFVSLCRDCPGQDAYPAKYFRIEWGPIFHRGRLDGSARVLVLGLDPRAHESIARRVLVNEAGHRVQGFLAKLGIDRSYVMLNAFLYGACEANAIRHYETDGVIAAYRHRWLDALLLGTRVQAVVTLGERAANAFRQWQAAASSSARPVLHTAIFHPFYPESVAASGIETAAVGMTKMLDNWNRALPELHATLTDPDTRQPLALYAPTLTADDLMPVPAADLPPGLPSWMRSHVPWAFRDSAASDGEGRGAIRVVVPAAGRSWLAH